MAGPRGAATLSNAVESRVRGLIAWALDVIGSRCRFRGSGQAH